MGPFIDPTNLGAKVRKNSDIRKRRRDFFPKKRLAGIAARAGPAGCGQNGIAV